MNFGLISGAFGLGQSLAGVFNSRSEKQVTNTQNKFYDRVAEVNVKRARRQQRYAQGAQRVQNAGMGNTAYGSMLFTFSDDARKARENISQIIINAETQKLANSSQVSNPVNSGLGFASNVASYAFENSNYISRFF